jgi:hypothetical protein
MGKPKYFKICILANLMQFIPTKGGLFKQIEFVNSVMFYISTVDPQIRYEVSLSLHYLSYVLQKGRMFQNILMWKKLRNSSLSLKKM